MSQSRTPTRADINRRGDNGARNKRIKTVVRKVVEDFLKGRSADDCMRELVQVAKAGVK